MDPGKIKAQGGIICLTIDWLEQRSTETPGKMMKQMHDLARIGTFSLRDMLQNL